jgi:hypothetical protein
MNSAMLDERNKERVLNWLAANPDAARDMLERAQRIRIAAARLSCDVFCEFVGRDELTHKPIRQAPIHRRFHEIASKHKRAVIWSHIESGKSFSLCVMRTLWLLGNNPDLRLAIVSNTAGQAVKIVKAIKTYIEQSEELRLVFPNLVPGDRWSDAAITVKRTSAARDPSVQAVGVHGNVLGSRLDGAFLDDVLDYENTRTDHARDDLYRWYNATISGRMTANAFIWLVGTAWHPEDLMHRLAALPGWFSERNPVVREDGSLSWPERWPAERIEESKTMGSLEFARQLLCVARDDTDSRFREEWLKRALERGSGRSMPGELRVVPPGYMTVTGVDLGTGKKNSDLSVIFTIAIHPNGDREVLCIESGRWTAPEIVQRIVNTHQRYLSIVFVESNAAQSFILDFTRDLSAVPVRPFTTGRNKSDPVFGVESIAVEMENGKWIIPSQGGQPLTNEVAAWMNGMMNYSPAGHTSDYLMACLPPGQRVLTHRGPTRIEEIEVGDRVLTHKGRWRKVTEVTSRAYDSTVYKLTPRNGPPITVTHEHPVLAMFPADFKYRKQGEFHWPEGWQWVRARDLNEHHSLLSPQQEFTEEPPALPPGAAALGLPLDEEFMQFVGILLASRAKVRPGAAHFSVKLPPNSMHLRLFCTQQANRVAPGTGFHIEEDRSSFRIVLGQKGVAAIRLLGAAGRRAALPWNWLRAPTSLRLAVLRGWVLVAEDPMPVDRFGNSAFVLRTRSLGMAEQARQTLVDAGFRPSLIIDKGEHLYTNPNTGVTSLVDGQYRVTLGVHDTAVLYNNTGSDLDRVHFGGAVRRPPAAGYHTERVPEGVRAPLLRIDKSTFRGTVYNLHVEEDESFVVHGYAVHNCWFAREGARTVGPKEAKKAKLLKHSLLQR